jgi:hypothetical protein
MVLSHESLGSSPRGLASMYIKSPRVAPTEGARRICNVPISDMYLGFKVRSLMTGRIGIIGDYKDIVGDEHYIDILWEHGADSTHPHYDYDLVEEYLEEEPV